MTVKKQRIWELDAFRGLCILCVIAVHITFDLKYLVGLDFTIAPVFQAIMDYGGVFFVLLSGICVTMGRSSVKRGAIVLGCGMVISLVTYAMIAMGMLDGSNAIWFGVLHLLGASMILYHLFRKLPVKWLFSIAIVLICLGYWFGTLTVSATWLFPLGLVYPGFSAGDYFPLLPHFGWFLMGAVLGKTVYKSRESLFPGVNTGNFLVKSLSFCGRHSLWIYLGHQPLVYGVLMLIFG